MELAVENKIETKDAVITIIAPGFIRVKFRDGAVIDKDSAIEIAIATRKLCGNQSYYTIVDTQNITAQVDHHAREYIATNIELSQIRKAQAILIGNMSSHILARFYIQYHKPKVPAKIFHDETKAIQWLKSLELI